MIDAGLAGKVAIVTGANHGIGAATARALAAQGVVVAIQYLRIRGEISDGTSLGVGMAAMPGEAYYRLELMADASAVTRAISDAGGKAIAFEIDIAQPANVPLLFDQVEAALGPVAVLVNNAAHCEQDTFLPDSILGADHRAPDGFRTRTLTADLHDQHFAVNSRAVALMMAEFARRHVASGASWGRIINISTDGAHHFPGEVSYGASKNALEAYTRSAALELGRFGITANIVSPGPIQTGWMTPEMEHTQIVENPIPRVGQPEDIADVIVFLASEQARWLTGQALYAGGGHSLG